MHRPTSPRFVWVDVSGSWSSLQEAGLLVEWRQVPAAGGDGRRTRWEALVLSAQVGAHGWSARVRWVRSEHVRPVQ